MIRYVALLRGINISGKNKISMSELKNGFEELNFFEVITYINSGNIIFIIPPTTYEEVFLEIGAAKPEYEKISNYKNAIFWSFDLKSYSKTNWIKTANTDCNHGQGLAVIHPIVYKHIYKDGLDKFVRFAKEVWNVETENKTDDEIANLGIKALSDFIKEIGLPITLTQMNITDKEILRKVADSSNITKGCCKELSHEEIYEILEKCL